MVVAVVICCSAENVHADDLSVITDAAFSGASGALLVNEAAGNTNLQFNGASIAGASTALATVLATQKTYGDAEATGAVATIGGQAFSNANGMISINQASGQLNKQANLVAIAIGAAGAIVADTSLSQSHTGGEPSDTPKARRVSIADTAFQNTTGIVQVNQTAGQRNSSANSFALRLPTGANP